MLSLKKRHKKGSEALKVQRETDGVTLMTRHEDKAKCSGLFHSGKGLDDWKPHLREVKGSALRDVVTMQKRGLFKWPRPIKIMIKMYRSCLLPKLTRDMVIWALDAIHNPKVLQPLEVAISDILRYMVGVDTRSSKTHLWAELGIRLEPHKRLSWKACSECSEHCTNGVKMT